MRTFARLLLLLALALVLAAPLAAGAQGQPDNQRFELLPVPSDTPHVTEKGYFVYQMQPSTQTTGNVVVRNPGAQPVTVELTAVDATTAQTGGSAFAEVGTAPAAVARWIQLDRTSVTLDPNTQQQIGFTVHAPDSAIPGQYLAGIAAYLPEAPPQDSKPGAANQLGSVIVAQLRYVIGVEVDVPGAANPHLSIADVKLLAYPSGTYIGIDLRNQGSMFLKPSGTLTLNDPSGKLLLTKPIVMGTFVTGTEVTYPVEWPGAVTPGSYPVVVELAYGDGKQATYQGTIEISGETADNATQPEGVPQSAQGSVANAPAGMLRAFLAGMSLSIACALLGVYIYRRRRRKQA